METVKLVGDMDEEDFSKIAKEIKTTWDEASEEEKLNYTGQAGAIVADFLIAKKLKLSKQVKVVETGVKTGSKVDNLLEAGVKASSKADDVAEVGMKASSKADDIAEAGAKASSKADDAAKTAGQTTALTVVKDNSGTNGSGVKISGEKSKSNIDDIRTKAIENNSVGKDKAPTNEQMPEVKIREITHKRLSEKVKGIRNKFKELYKEGKVPKGIVVRGNIAIAEVDISGMPKEFMAHSSINTKNAKAAQYGTFSYLPETRNLKSYVDAPTGIKGLTIEEALKKEAVPRYNDAEAKILEDITSRIKDTPDIKGKINLYTEKACCQSCSNLILEFKRKFPNIELNIYTDNL